MSCALALWSMGAPARAETSVYGDEVHSRSASHGDDVEILPEVDEDARQTERPRRRGRGMRVSGSIVLGVAYTLSVTLSAQTMRRGIEQAWPGFVPLFGPAIAAGTARDAVYQDARDEALANVVPHECGEYDSYCGLADGLVVETSAGLSEGIWVAANALLTIIQIAGAILLSVGHVLGSRSHARIRRPWISRPTHISP